MMNAKEKLKKGIIKEEDIPYMQRTQGSWDNADVKGAKKKAWSETDKKYQANWAPAKADWSGNAERKGPASINKNTSKDDKPKKLFGLF
jgi:hypothetical protein